MSANQITDNAMSLYAEFEGLHLQPYICPAGKLTSLIGHVIKKGEEKKYLAGMSIDDAIEMIKRDSDGFYQKVPKLTVDEAHRVKRADLKEACAEVDKRLSDWKCSVNNDVYSWAVDMVFNGGPGFLDESIKTYLLKKDTIGAVLRGPLYCGVRKSPKIFIPLAGLTFRRYSFVWLALTGEKWRIGSEGSNDKDWAEVALFLTKLTALLRKWGRVNPLPYKNNLRENQNKPAK